MSQESFRQVTSEWKNISEFITVDSEKTYYIQNRGPCVLVVIESDGLPSSKHGIFVKPYDVVKYKKGNQDLYLSAFSSVCGINITSEG